MQQFFDELKTDTENLYLVVHHRRSPDQQGPDQSYSNSWLDNDRLEAIITNTKIAEFCQDAQQKGERVFVHQYTVHNDEYSMIDERLLKDIINAVHNTKTKVLFCGDPFQLPPVKASRPPVCALDIDEITLFDVVRYDGELAVVAEDIRGHDKYQSSYYPFESSTDGTIIKYDREIS